VGKGGKGRKKRSYFAPKRKFDSLSAPLLNSFFQQFTSFERRARRFEACCALRFPSFVDLKDSSERVLEKAS